MINWDKTDYIENSSVPNNLSNGQLNNQNLVSLNTNSYYLNDYEMLLCTEGEDGYYVVM
jgi:hypothetical protein